MTVPAYTKAIAIGHFSNFACPVLHESTLSITPPFIFISLSPKNAIVIPAAMSIAEIIKGAVLVNVWMLPGAKNYFELSCFL